MLIHLDTDLGGDPDDACALAMLLGWPGVELTGITTTIDPGGRRAGYVRHCLELLGRDDIPVAAGAEVSMTTHEVADPYTDERFWPAGIAPSPSSPGAALDLLDASVERGATIAGIGPCTNLALLELARPGRLGRTSVVQMGGWLEPAAAGLPTWGPERDFNLQWDARAAQLVACSAPMTLVTLPVTLKTHLRAADLPRLRASGPLGRLVAGQTEAHARDAGKDRLARSFHGLPEDLLNFHYDPVTCAVAVGWPGATVVERRLRPQMEGDLLRFHDDPDGRVFRVVADLDGPAFSEVWIAAVEAAQRHCDDSSGCKL